MKTTRTIIRGTALAMCLSLAVFAQETKVKAKDVPAPARAATTNAYPKAQVKGWEKVVEDGKTTYEESPHPGRTTKIVTADGMEVK